MSRHCLVAIFVLATSIAAGCGGGDSFPVAKTVGKVTCNGQPVAKAIVYFEPLQTGNSAKVGKQGFSFTGDDGSYTISTYGNGDGAVIGKVRIRVGRGDSKCDCVTNDEKDILQTEIKAGQTNTFDLTLPPVTVEAPSSAPVLNDDGDDKPVEVEPTVPTTANG